MQLLYLFSHQFKAFLQRDVLQDGVLQHRLHLRVYLDGELKRQARVFPRRRAVWRHHAAVLTQDEVFDDALFLAKFHEEAGGVLVEELDFLVFLRVYLL